MKHYHKQAWISFLMLILIIFLFLFTSYLVQKNIIFFESLFVFPFLGMLIYVGLNIFETVFAPLSVFPTIPMASHLWGPVVTALLSIFAWTVGAIIAFALARRYGRPLVENIFSFKKIQHIESLLPERNIFLGIVLLRMVVPVDVLSYALGIFTHIRWKTYILATLMGITPGAFIFAYVGGLSLVSQIIAFFIAGILVAFVVYFLFKEEGMPFLKVLWKRIFKW